MTINEDLLHYIWKTKSFDLSRLYTTAGKSLEIINFGQHNHNAGPDFKQARILIEGIEWVGSIEMHLMSSDWRRHNHAINPAYQNVILHVVLEDDEPARYNDGSAIPTLSLSSRISERHISQYKKLFAKKHWVPCAGLIISVADLTKTAMIEQSLVDRLTDKASMLLDELQSLGSDWRELIYRRIAWSFGLSINSESFIELTTRTPYSIILKHRDNLHQLEALLFGQSGLLNAEKEDHYSISLKAEYDFLRNKYGLNPMNPAAWNFSKLLPPSFPTIRIAQLAAFLHHNDRMDLFIHEAKVEDLTSLFKFQTSDYWTKHFRFGTPSKSISKKLGSNKIEIIYINALVPLLFAYGHILQDYDLKAKAIELLSTIRAEKNSVIDRWARLEVKATTAADTQGLLHLKKQYCDKHKCLRCRIGHAIMTEST